MDILASKGKLGDRFDDYIGRARSGVPNSDTGSEQGEIDELAAIDRQALNLLFIDYRTHHGARRFGNLAHILYGNLLAHLADGEIEINATDGAEIEMHLLSGFLEAAFLRRHRVVAGREEGDLVVAGRRRIGGSRNAGVRVDGSDGGFGDGGSGGVIYASLDAAGNGLGSQPIRRGQEQ